MIAAQRVDAQTQPIVAHLYRSERTDMENRRINVGVLCRILPHYRLAVFERLSQMPGIQLMVYYSKEPSYSSLKTIDPRDRFPSRRIEMKAWKWAGQEVLFQPEARGIVNSQVHDVVILSGNLRLLSNLLALVAARRRGIGVVWWTMGRQPSQSRMSMRIGMWLTALCDAVLAYTHDERTFFIEKGIPDKKVFVAQNTIDLSVERNAAEQWSATRVREFVQQRGLQGKKVFLFCGQLRPRKQIELLFEALRILRVHHPDYHLVIAGGSPAESTLRELAHTSGIGDAITWLGPLYDPDELAPWFLTSRALVVPRAIGLAVLHACAYGLPCITTADRRYQTPEVAALRQGYNCCLFRDGDAQDLAEKMRLLAEDDRLQKELGSNARTTIEQEYTMEKMVEGFVQAISYAASRMNHRSRS